MQNVISAILSYHGLSISHEAPNVQRAVLHGELVYTLAMHATRDPDGWLDHINAEGDIAYTVNNAQPYNNQGKDNYMEIRELDHYQFFRDANGELRVHEYFEGGSRFLNTYIKLMDCVTYNRATSLNDVALNRVVIGAFKHFNIGISHVNYQDKYLCYLLKTGQLLKTLQWLSIYYKHDMSCIDRIGDDDNFTKFGVAVMFSECINDLDVNLTLPGMPEFYRERIDDEYCAVVLDTDNQLTVITERPLEGLYGIRCSSLHQSLARVANAPLVRRTGGGVEQYLQLGLRYVGAEYPDTTHGDIYLLSIVERGLLNKALNIYAERGSVMTWRDLSSLVETYDETSFVECLE